MSVAREGGVAVTIRSDDDYTSVEAAGDLVLDGRLTLDVQGALTPGTVLTIMRGDSIEGNFHAMPERRVVNTGGYLFRVVVSKRERDADREARGAGNAVTPAEAAA